MAKKTYNGVEYDDSLDYSAAIQKAQASGQDTSSLVAARNAKIAGQYGGVEPTMYGSDKTYSQLAGSGSSADKRAISNAILSVAGGSVPYTTSTGKTGNLTNAGQSWKAGTDYSQLAYDSAAQQFAKNGYIDLDYIDDILNRRQDKMDSTGAAGASNLELWQDILAKYNGALGPNMATTNGSTYAGAVRPTTDYNGFSYEEAPEYYDAYQTAMNDMLDKIINREAFSYNAEEDPLYQQYKEMYTREGNRAMQDTLGQVSARTGGLASSYATSAAQQMNQQYMQQLADKVPELYQMAYQMYLDDINLQTQDYNLLQSASDRDYSRYRDTISDYYTNRDFEYGAYRDNIADTQWQTQFDYNAERDSIADQRYDTEWEYQLSRDEIADQRYNTEWAYQQQQDAAAAARAAAGSGGSGTSYGDEVTAVAAWLGLSEKEANALKNMGSPEYTKALQEILGSDGGIEPTADVPEITTYQAAVDYLKDKVPTGATGIMRESEWKQRKASYQNTGIGGDEVRLNATYAEYLNDFVQYKLETSGK